jgi:large subunit ribosomal protein L21
MYAIVETGGKQYRVQPGDTLAVERLAGEPGDTLDLNRVLLVAGNGTPEARVGAPAVDGAVVRAEVVDHIRGEKIIVFRYKSKVRYRRKTGHRQALTRLRITDILVDGASALPLAEPVAVEPPRRESAAETEPAGETAEATAPARRRRATAAAPPEAPTESTPSNESTEAVQEAKE